MPLRTKQKYSKNTYDHIEINYENTNKSQQRLQTFHENLLLHFSIHEIFLLHLFFNCEMEADTGLYFDDVTVFGCRAPVLVALALIEGGLKYEDTVALIRQ